MWERRSGRRYVVAHMELLDRHVIDVVAEIAWPDQFQPGRAAPLGDRRRGHAAIARLTASQLDDELLIRRLKKRKLALKDRITVIERMLEPDERA